MKYTIFGLIFTTLTLNSQVFNISSSKKLRESLKISASNNENNTIILTDGIYKTIDDNKGTFKYFSSEDKNLSIIGLGSYVILSGDNNSQILNSQSTKGSTMLLKNLNFIDGNNTSTENLLNLGGAVYTNYNLNIVDCNFTNNNSNNKGGGFYSLEDVVVSNSTFTNNSSKYGGGGFSFYGNATLTNCNFINNTAKYGKGGAIYSNSMYPNSNIIVDNSTFKKNSAKYEGGGFYYYGSVKINNSTFIDNTAKYGGGFYAFNNATINNSIFIDNVANYGGGGFYALNNATINNSTFINNIAISSGGGGFSSSGTIVRDSNLTTNTAIYGGGFNSDDVVISNSIFTDNSTKFYGGGFNSDDAVVSNSIFTDNSAEYGGGGFNADDAVVSNSIFTNNSGLKFGGGGFRSSDTIVSNSIFTNNNNGIYLTSGESHIIVNSIFYNNSKDISGSNKTYANVSIKTLENNYINISELNIVNHAKNNIFSEVELGLNSNYTLGSNSDLIDAGTINYLNKFNNLETDLLGNKRILGSSIDIGVYEYSSTKPIINSISFSGEMKAYETITFNVDSTAIDDRSIISTEYDYNNDGIFSSNSSIKYPQGDYMVKVKVTDSQGEYSISQTKVSVESILFEDMTLEQQLKSLTPNISKINSILLDINGTKEVSVSSNLTNDYINNLFSGWHLIGTKVAIVDLSIFSSSKIIWIYNSSKLSWSAYSPDDLTKLSIQDLNISLIKSIPKNYGIWILK